MRDTQRKRVYDWEAPFWKSQPLLELKEIDQFVGKIQRHYKIEHRPTVKDGRGCTSARYTWCGNLVLPRWSRSKWVVCHEIAHWLIHHNYGRNRVASHGPEFVGQLIYLAIRYDTHDVKTLTESARIARVDFKHPDNFKPKRKK